MSHCIIPAMRPFRCVVTLLLALALAVLARGAPRNVILMIGDGMGPDIIAAAGACRFGNEHWKFAGQRKLTLETLGRHYYVMTCSASGKGYDFTWKGGDREYPKAGATDSAAAATAMATGVKTFDGAIATDCEGQPLPAITATARQLGLKTGIVTSVLFFDATPAAFAAHNGARGNAAAIINEMLMTEQPDVLMGAGNPGNFPDEVAFKQFDRAAWEAIAGGKTPYALVQDRAEFQALAAKPAAGKVLGLFRSASALKPRNADGKGADPALPTLAEMARGALASLANPAGFVLMVEGGAIDKQAHPNSLDATLGEVLAFDEAVAAVLEWIAAHGGWEENLLIITADHDTGYLNGVKPAATGTLPEISWGTGGGWGGHANRLVDLYCQGQGADRFDAFALRAQDFERGLVTAVDNTAIYRVMKSALPPVGPEGK